MFQPDGLAARQRVRQAAVSRSSSSTSVIDFFLNDTARHADIVLPGSLQEEDEGTVTQVEGRVIKINKAIDCPGEARQDWRVIQDLARALNRPHGFTFESPREIFDELRRASKGGVADYSGITYEKIDAQMGVFWPCYSEDPKTGQPVEHPGTPRLFEPGSYNPVAHGNGPFYFPDGKARFNVADYRPPVDDADGDYPVLLTTGRVVSQFLSGTQTRRIGPLVDQYPEPRIEMHPRLASRLGIADGDWTTAETRRGTITLKAMVVTTIRPDTVFIPYHWAGPKSVNQLTVAAQDPISKIPRVQGLRLPRAEGRRSARLRGGARTAAVAGIHPMAKPADLHFFIDPNRCIGCQACVQACTECDTHRGESMIHLEFVDRSHSTQTVPVVCMHCEQPTCAEVCPADAIKRTGDGVVQSARKPRCIACGNCVLACPFGVPEVYEDRQLMMKCDMCYDRSSVGKKPMCATVCPSQALFFGTRERDRTVAPALRPGQPLPVRTADDHHGGLHDDAATAGRGASFRRRHRGDGGAAARACHPRHAAGRRSVRMRSRSRHDATNRSTKAPDGRPLEAQPAWRRDFPIDWPQDAYVERRDFVKFMVLTSAAFAIGQLWIGAQNWWRRRRE